MLKTHLKWLTELPFHGFAYFLKRNMALYIHLHKVDLH